MTKKSKPFKIRYRKGGDCRILNFDKKQLHKYRPEVQLDYLAMLLKQTSKANLCANGKMVRLDWQLQEHFDTLLKSFNDQSRCSKDILEIHTHRSLTDYCSNGVNICVLQDFEIMMTLFENYYKWQDKHRTTQNIAKTAS